MVNKRFWLVMLVMVLVFGMAIIGCNNDPDNGNEEGSGNTGGGSSGGGGGANSALNGTWFIDDGEMTFNNGNFENFQNGLRFIKGTYTINGNSYTRTVTHVGKGAFPIPSIDSSKWYSENELLSLGVSDEDFFKPYSAIYYIDGNKLTLTFDGSTIPEIWTRKWNENII